jgi:hypothetical protein
MMTINLFSVGFVALLATVKLARNDIAESPVETVAPGRARMATDPSQFLARERGAAHSVYGHFVDGSASGGEG